MKLFFYSLTAALLCTSAALADVARPVLQSSTTKALVDDLATGGKKMTISSTGTLEWVNGATLTGGSYLKAALGMSNVENTAISTYAGTTNVTTLGTITTGVWHGTAITDTYISSAATWNAKESGLTFSTGLSRSGNTITLATSGITAGSYGSSLQVARYTVDAYGRITAVSSQTIAPPVSAITGFGTGIGTWLATPIEANLKAAQSGLAWLDTAQTFTAAQTVTPAANASGMTINGSLSGGGVTRSVLKVTDDWSASTGGTSVPTLLELSHTDVGGAPNYTGDRMISIKRNGSEVFYINHGGSMFIAGGVSVDGNYSWIEMPASYALRWGNYQTSLYRDANGILHQRSENGTITQIFRVNNTFTSTSNFEAGVMDWQTTSNTLRIGSDVGSGGGTARDVQMIRGGVVKATIDANTTAHEQPVKLKSYIVSGLPSAATCGAGSMAFVTDATATTAYSTVAGGGSNKVLVISDGTDWIIH